MNDELRGASSSDEIRCHSAWKRPAHRRQQRREAPQRIGCRRVSTIHERVEKQVAVAVSRQMIKLWYARSHHDAARMHTVARSLCPEVLRHQAAKVLLWTEQP